MEDEEASLALRKKYFILIRRVLSFALCLSLGAAFQGVAKNHVKTLGSGATNGGYHFITKRLSTLTKKTRERATGGSVTNIKALASGEFSIGIAQSNIVEDAVKGEGVFKSQGPIKNLTTIARLYPEYAYLVVNKESPIQSLMDLKGIHVGLGSAGSGTLESSIKILMAYGLKEIDVNGHYGRIGSTIESFKAGKIKAFFYVTSSPSKILRDLHEQKSLRLIPIKDEGRAILLAQNKKMVPSILEKTPYNEGAKIETVSLNAYLLANAHEDESLIYEMTKKLWEYKNDTDVLSPQLEISLAATDLSAPLHPGAVRYYREKKILNSTTP